MLLLDPRPRGREGLTYNRAGDEFGTLVAEPGGRLPGLGERLREFLVPHCDPTVNLYDRIWALRGDKVEAVWPYPGPAGNLPRLAPGR